jgi:hypothetical protein
VLPIETYKVDNYTLEIYSDLAEDEECNPRNWENNIGKMVCFHRRYDLGDKHDINTDDFSSFDEIEEYLIEEKGAEVILPLYLYDHSGLTISSKPFSCPWDSGQVGFIYATSEDITKNIGSGNAEERKSKATKCLLGEIKMYDYYLRGEIYGYKLLKDDIKIDSCWGFFGLDLIKNGLIDSLDVDKEIRDMFVKVVSE